MLNYWNIKLLRDISEFIWLFFLWIPELYEKKKEEKINMKTTMAFKNLKEREENNKNLGESINYANLLPLHEYVIMQSIKITVIWIWEF